jgi:hypothetical protein
MSSGTSITSIHIPSLDTPSDSTPSAALLTQK